MERGDYERRLERKRALLTDEDVHELIALIHRDQRAAKVRVIKPISGRAVIAGSLAVLSSMRARAIRHGTTP